MSNLGLVIAIMLSAFITGGLARLAVPGPDPMPAWMTVTIGLAGSGVGFGVAAATHGHHPYAASLSAFGTAILAGHIHQAAVSERHEFEVIAGDVRGVVVSIAPGFGQPRPNRLGEARGLHVYEAGDDTLSVWTYIWRGDDWGLTAERTFPRGRRPLSIEKP